LRRKVRQLDGLPQYTAFIRFALQIKEVRGAT